MQPLENLTKENFWNSLMEKYPIGMKLFCDWIDEYKKTNNWANLFNAAKADDREYFDWNGDAVEIEAPKYHDLPLAMQIGIFLEFMAYENIGLTISDDKLPPWNEQITQSILQVNDREVAKAHSEKMKAFPAVDLL